MYFKVNYHAMAYDQITQIIQILHALHRNR